ncbi:MAG: hypothetical protein CM15mP68_7270 [Pseudomonadota bacterium]|nr:MAG: hypothetical protein CM15mP68_7270 [Pseudomonadota bacterium]
MTFETPCCLDRLRGAVHDGWLLWPNVCDHPVDYQYHDTYFGVAHFHYVLVPGALFRSSPRCTFGSPSGQAKCHESLGKLHFWLSFIGVNITFFPQHFSGLVGMPRRIPD